MDLNAPGLENALVKLEPLTEAHRDMLRATDAIEHMWQSMPAIQRLAGFDAYYDHMMRCEKAQEAVSFAILCPDTGKFIGVSAYLEPNRTHRRVRIGYSWLDHGFRGKGIYQAVQHLLISRAVEWGAKRISWHIEARNERALRAIEALGAVHEGTMRNYARFADGTWVDMAILSMLRDEAKIAVTRLTEHLNLSEA